MIRPASLRARRLSENDLLMRLHSAAMPRCRHCGKRCVDDNALAQHTMAVHPEEAASVGRTHPCPTCGHSFRGEQGLRHHLAQAHGVTP